MRFQKSKFSIIAKIIFTTIIFLSLYCNKSPIGPTKPDPLPAFDSTKYIPLSQFRTIYQGADIIVPAGTKKIRGVVISNSVNESSGNYRIEDESASGIILYAASGSPVYAQGTVLEINSAGVGILNLYNGDLELKSVPVANVTPLSGTLNITPRSTTIAQIIANKDTWASTLVQITGITSIAQGSTNSTGTNYTVTDATGSLTMFVRAASGISVNTSGTKITGFVSVFNSSAEIGIRSATDIQ